MSPDPSGAYVAACALGLAYSDHERADSARCVAELVAAADQDPRRLERGRTQLSRLEVCDGATRRWAEALLLAAAASLTNDADLGVTL